MMLAAIALGDALALPLGDVAFQPADGAGTQRYGFRELAGSDQIVDMIDAVTGNSRYLAAPDDALHRITGANEIACSCPNHNYLIFFIAKRDRMRRDITWMKGELFSPPIPVFEG